MHYKNKLKPEENPISDSNVSQARICFRMERVTGSRVKGYWERSAGSSVTPEEAEAEAKHFLPEILALHKAQISAHLSYYPSLTSVGCDRSFQARTGYLFIKINLSPAVSLQLDHQGLQEELLWAGLFPKNTTRDCSSQSFYRCGN